MELVPLLELELELVPLLVPVPGLIVVPELVPLLELLELPDFFSRAEMAAFKAATAASTCAWVALELDCRVLARLMAVVRAFTELSVY